MTVLTSLLLLLAGPTFQDAAAPATPKPAPTATPDPWAPIRFMAGEWEGASEGEPGKGTVERTYRFVLSDRFIHEENVSAYPPQPKNDKGEVHHHQSFFSYDRARRVLVLRQFHQEGFVNRFAMRSAGSDHTLTFEGETLENVPAGWKARETYEAISKDEFVETFEIASTGPYQIYSRSRFQRKRAR